MSRRLAVIAFLAVACSGAAQAASGTWTTSRTSYGDPDLQGYWTNHTIIALQRPAALGDEARFTDTALAAYIKAQIKEKNAQFGNGAVHYAPDDYGLGDDQLHLVRNLNTSIVTDPKNGRLPTLTPEAKAREAANIAFNKAHQFDSAKTRGLGERCIEWPNEGPPVLPAGYNANYQIVQTEGAVVILSEMIHDARVIPLDGRPHEGPKVRNWFGDSRGHWEGDTLVVETTNFNDRIHSDFILGYAGTTEALKVVERFTRTGSNRIDYEFTVEDPRTWTKPWSGSSPWERVDGPIFEYACHEGNYGLPNTLSGARAQEREAAASGTAAQ